MAYTISSSWLPAMVYWPDHEEREEDSSDDPAAVLSTFVELQVDRWGSSYSVPSQ